MASTILSVLKLIKRLSAPIRDLFGSSSSSPCQVGADLEKLGSMLHEIQAVLNDAEEREEQSVKLWLTELKFLTYDAEDVLDELEFELLRYNMERANQTSSTHKRKRRVSTTTPPTPLHDISFQHNMMSRIKEIREGFEKIEKERQAFHLVKEDGMRRSGSTVRPPTGPLVDESHVYGREADMEKVVHMLVSEDYNQENVSVLSMVGMGGLGKTTLAQMVYKDERVKKHFQLRSWVHVSVDFNLVRLTRAIIESITKARSELHDLNSLQEFLKQKLTGNRFLLVLDDVWCENRSDWEALKVALIVGAKGSRVLITTRSEKVSDIMGTKTYQLNPLSDGDCWSLFSKYAFGQEKLDDYPCLVSIGNAIVKKCGGLPLTVKILGGLLSHETNEHEWERILRNDIWNGPQDKSSILPVLRLSYQYLPSHLKQCFAYCGIFKGLKFEKDQLVRMWNAQGFIHPEEEKRPEDIGDEYFDNLLRRSFFQYTEKDLDDSEMFTMHDLIHDLAQSISMEECSIVEEGKLSNISRNTRHSSIVCYDFQTLVPFEAAQDPKALRTFLLIDRSNDHLDVNVLNDLFLMMKCLRILDLSFVDIDELPDSIGTLKHLRYLDLTGTNIEKLPESVSKLYNLETLELQQCDIVELPKGTKDLINLRHLILDNASTQLSMMPLGIGNLSSIQTLPIFVLGKNHGSARIGELKDLNDLRGELFIVGLQNVTNGKHDAQEADLKSKKHLDTLLLEWGTGGDAESVSAFEQDEEVLENLKPHTNLKELMIGDNYRGIRFPGWMGDPSFSKLKTVGLSDCVNCDCLPPLGQLPSLRYLSICRMKRLQCVGREFLGEGMIRGFPSLLVLSFSDMPEWKEWWSAAEDGVEFPCLFKITIEGCPKLKSLSLHSLTALEELTIQDCIDLNSVNCLFNCSLAGQQKCHLMSLKRLEFWRCTKLVFPQVDQLPPTLVNLYIHRCPLLEEWSQSHCDKLVDIPELQVTGAELSLQDVVIEEKAREKNLKFDETLKKLELGWYLGEFQYEDEPEEVLESLQPHTNLQELTIEGYRGLMFANWVGDPSFSKLVKVILSNCMKCKCLPPVGQLPSLKELYITSMHGVEIVGHEFSGGGGFRSLEILEFQDMPEWEEWQVQEGALPSLCNLTIKKCPKLRGLENSLSRVTSLSKLRLHYFDDEQIISKLWYLTPCSTLCISHFPNLREFTHNFLPCNLKELEVEDCKRLTTLPILPSSLCGLLLAGCNEAILSNSSSSFSTLSHLRICRFRNLTCLPLSNLPALRELSIFRCPELVSLRCFVAHSPSGLHTLSSLKLLSIEGCPKLELSTEEQLPSELQYINITDCPLLVKCFQRDRSKFASICKLWIDGVLVFLNDSQFPDGTLITNLDDAIRHVRGGTLSDGERKE